MNHSLFWRPSLLQRCALTLSSPESRCAQSPIAAQTERIGACLCERRSVRLARKIKSVHRFCG